MIVTDAISQVLNEVFAGIFWELSHRFGKGRGIQTFFAHVQNWGEVDQLIQADVFGGVSTPSCLSKRYMQSFMDDDSRGLFLSREVRSLSKVKSFCGSHKELFILKQSEIPRGSESRISLLWWAGLPFLLSIRFSILDLFLSLPS